MLVKTVTHGCTKDKLDSGLAELFEKADVVFEQQAYVVEAEHHGAHPINAKSEREASKFLGIDIYSS